MKSFFITILLLMISFHLPAPGIATIYILRTAEECHSLTWQNIDWYIDYYDLSHKDIVKAQIRHETGNLTSRFCKEQNNLFGMRLAKTRETTATGEGNRMAVYDSWPESIRDYKIWQDRYYHGGDYLKFLKDIGYATDHGYMRKLRKYLK